MPIPIFRSTLTLTPIFVSILSLARSVLLSVVTLLTVPGSSALGAPLQQLGEIQYRVSPQAKEIRYWLPLNVQQTIIDAGDGRNYWYQVQFSLADKPFDSDLKRLAQRHPNHKIVHGSARSLVAIEFDAGIGELNFPIGPVSVQSTIGLEASQMIEIRAEQFKALLENQKTRKKPSFKVRVSMLEPTEVQKTDVRIPMHDLCERLRAGASQLTGFEALLRLKNLERYFRSSIPFTASREQILKEAMDECIVVDIPSLPSGENGLALSKLVLKAKEPARQTLSVSSRGETEIQRLPVQNDAALLVGDIEVLLP